VPRLTLATEELEKIWETLSNWATNKKESSIVRVNALQGLFEISKLNKEFKPHFSSLVSKIEKEGVPCLDARIRRCKNTLI
jgi:hypothetical protein